jgi:hypothetical protein
MTGTSERRVPDLIAGARPNFIEIAAIVRTLQASQAQPWTYGPTGPSVVAALGVRLQHRRA